MPNHVPNVVSVFGPIDDLLRFQEECFSPKDDGVLALDFNKVIPMPPDVAESSSEIAGAMPLWYTWSVENWGTKWNSYQASNPMFHSPEGVPQAIMSFRFWTAWSPPIPIYEALKVKYPSLIMDVQYVDEGGGFAGRWSTKEGDVALPCTDELRDQLFSA